MNFNYGNLIKKSWTIAWKNKVLWFFGIFITAGVEGLVYRGDFDLDSISYQAANFADMPKSVLLMITGFLILLGLVLFIISIISQGAMIKGIDNATLKAKLKLGELWKFGVSRFWKILAIELILGAAALILMAPVFVALFAQAAWLQVLLMIWILLLIIAFVVFSNFFFYVFAYAVIDDKPVKEALIAGWKLYRNNLKVSILVSLIVLGLSLAFAIGIAIASVVLLVPFFLLGILFGIWWQAVGAFVSAIIGGFVILAFSVLVRGILNAFTYGMPLLTYMEISGRKVLATPKQPTDPMKQ